MDENQPKLESRNVGSSEGFKPTPSVLEDWKNCSTHPGADNILRVVTVKCSQAEMKGQWTNYAFCYVEATKSLASRVEKQGVKTTDSLVVYAS